MDEQITPQPSPEEILDFSHIQEPTGQIKKEQEDIWQDAALEEGSRRNELRKSQDELAESERIRDNIKEREGKGVFSPEADGRRIAELEEKIKALKEKLPKLEEKVQTAGAETIAMHLTASPELINTKANEESARKIYGTAYAESFGNAVGGNGEGVLHYEFSEEIRVEAEKSRESLMEAGYFGLLLENALFKAAGKVAEGRAAQRLEERLKGSGLSQDVIESVVRQVRSDFAASTEEVRFGTIMDKLGMIKESGDKIEATDEKLISALKTIKEIKDLGSDLFRDSSIWRYSKEGIFNKDAGHILNAPEGMYIQAFLSIATEKAYQNALEEAKGKDMVLPKNFRLKIGGLIWDAVRNFQEDRFGSRSQSLPAKLAENL